MQPAEPNIAAFYCRNVVRHRRWRACWQAALKWATATAREVDREGAMLRELVVAIDTSRFQLSVKTDATCSCPATLRFIRCGARGLRGLRGAAPGVAPLRSTPLAGKCVNVRIHPLLGSVAAVCAPCSDGGWVAKCAH